MDLNSVNADSEKTRPCPTCRMMISVLATKCRYCGESVGRPKDEARTMTAEDLGGETVKHYAPSASVMDALEAFRSEEGMTVAREEKQSRLSIFRKKGAPEKAEKAAYLTDGLPELSQNSEAVSSSGRYVAASKPKPKPRPVRARSSGPSWVKKVCVGAAFIAVVLLLYFGVVEVAAIISNMGGDETNRRRVVNEAVAILEQGGPADKAIEAAAYAQREDPTKDNERVLEQARERVLEQVRDLLNSRPWNPNDLREAARISAAALREDGTEEIRALQGEVLNDVTLYRSLILNGIDRAQGKEVANVSIRLDGRVQTLELNENDDFGPVPEGEERPRFQLQRILTNSVTIYDRLRNRQLTTKVKAEIY